jgi:hypothetical protein
MKIHSLLAVLALVSLGGCQEVAIVDDVDLDLDWNPITGPTDALHSPYVQGAQFAVWVNTSKKESLRGWHIESNDSSVIALGQGVLSANSETLFHAATAKNAGTTELRVLDGGGGVRHTHAVEVRFPDRLDVLPHGPLLIGRDGVVSEEHPAVLSGGTATFLVQYYAGGDRLNGHGALASVASAHVDTHVEKSSFLEDRDWLVVDASQGGVSEELGLQVAGAMARTLPVDTVEEAAIDSMKLSSEGEDHAHEHEWLVLLAEAFDKGARTIYGAEFQFTANAVQQQGFGDLYRYEYAAKIPVMLEATHGAHADGLMIHSAGGFVDSTNRIGCSAVPGRATSSSLGAGLLLLVGVLLLRQARRARISATMSR